MTLNLERVTQNSFQTEGILRLFDSKDILAFQCYTLELPWKYNEKNVSCIPEGDYPIVKHHSPKFGDSFWIKDVPGRSEILIHAGNYVGSINPRTGSPDTEGCILPGRDLVDFTGDGHKEVTDSTTTLNKLLKLCPQELLIRVHSNAKPNVLR